MIKDKKRAREISSLMLDIGKRINDSIANVQQGCTEEEFKAYRSACGKILGYMLVDILNPLYESHPDLKPKDLH